MTKDEFKRIFRTSRWPEFFRATDGLQCVVYDFDYAKTRKMLDPNWNEYNVPKGHDIVQDDVSIHEANLVTSQVRGTNLHRIVLDLDYGASREQTPVGTRVKLNISKSVMGIIGSDDHLSSSELLEALNECGIPRLSPKLQRLPYHTGLTTAILDIVTGHDVALVPSSTIDHYHLIIKNDVTWDKYTKLLKSLAIWGIIEDGYAAASIARGFTAIRPPWVHKKK